jgi:hypothetical protein
MLSLTDFLSRLPGVMPRKARTAIIQGDILSQAERRDIFMRDASFLDTVQLVGPDAAAAILAAYRAGKLPMNTGEKIGEAPQAVEYANDDTLREQSRERRRKVACVKDISLVKEGDFSDNRLLDRIFWENLGKGEGTLKLAGIDVFKSLHGYSSNSGKSTGYKVTFHWTGSDGEHRSSGTGTPSEAFNRRNDADRDWGLPE